VKNPALPPEIDEMLWVVAESRDDATVQEFERRYPQYRAELYKRRAMLEALRKARPTETPPRRSTPLPRERVLHRASPLRLWWAPLMGLFLAGVAIASYWITRELVHSPPTPALTQEPAPRPEVMPTPRKAGVGGAEMQPFPQATPRDTAPGSVPRPSAPPPGAPRVVLPLKGLTLHQALREVSRQAQIPITIMPDVPEMPLNLRSLLEPPPPTDEINLTVEEMLLLLEKVAPIRVLDNGPDGYVILPLEKVHNVPSPADGRPLRENPSGSPGNGKEPLLHNF
jgi:hypothetical protein